MSPLRILSECSCLIVGILSQIWDSFTLGREVNKGLTLSCVLMPHMLVLGLSWLLTWQLILANVVTSLKHDILEKNVLLENVVYKSNGWHSGTHPASYG